MCVSAGVGGAKAHPARGQRDRYVDLLLLSLCNSFQCVYTPPPMIVGGDFSQGTVDSAAIFLFELFLVEPRMTRGHAEEIRRLFGPYPASTVNKICKGVERILTYLPPGWRKAAAKVDTSKDTKKRKEFGHGIQFKYGDGFLDHPSSIATDLPGYDSLSEGEDDVPVKSKIVNFVTNTIQTASAKGGGARRVSPAPVSNGGPSSLYSSEWLVEQCKDCVGGGESAGELTWKELYQAVFEHLSSGRDNTVIQNDVRPYSFVAGVFHFEFC